MKNTPPPVLIFLLIAMAINTVRIAAREPAKEIEVSLQKRVPSGPEKVNWIISGKTEKWNVNETAIVICDMWDKHWCKGASARVTEMAPFMNRVVSLARDKGILIVHAPSEVVGYYKNFPAREPGRKYKSSKAAGLISRDLLPSEKDAIWPIDQSDGGCDCTPECKEGSPWTHQTDLIGISDRDAISDSGEEIAGLFYVKGIKNVILMGVHTNMCVIGRSFGLRNMVRLGMNVVLMRDLTDTMYDPKQPPYVSHFTGTSLIVEYIEKYVCPTMISSDITHEKPFEFSQQVVPGTGTLDQ